MREDKLNYAANGQIDIDLFLPQCSVLSESDKQNYTKQGYAVGYTRSEWASAFPKLDPEYVFYSRTLFGEMVYYDAEKYVYFPLSIYNGTVFNPSGDPQDRILKALESLYRASAEKDYSRLFLHLNDGAGLQVIKHVVKNEPPSPSLYEAVIHAYTMSDFGFGKLDSDFVGKLLSCKSDEQRTKTEQALSCFPDTMVVYRGEGSRSTPASQALSWAVEESAAYFFAARPGGQGACVHTARVKKQDVLEYMVEREQEVLIAPDRVNIIKTELLPSVSQLAAEPMPQKLQRALNHSYELATSHRDLFPSDGSAHTLDHCVRVLYLAMVIGKTKGICAKEAAILARAAAFHDCGRTNDCIDEAHGRESCRKYSAAFGEDDAVNFLMTYHCIEDETAEQFLTPIGSLSAERILLLYRILKDADALDRVRFGMRDIDLDQFRFPDTKNLILAAKMLLTKHSE